MARPSSLEPRYLESRDKWVLNVPPELSDTGKRRQLFFPTKRAASADIEKLKARADNFGVSLAQLTPARIAEAAEAYNLLAPFNIGLLDAVRAHVAILESRSASVSFRTAFERFAELKKRKSAKYREEIRLAKATFEPLLDRLVCDITAADLEPILDKLPGGSRNAKMRRLRSVFNLAIKRGWMNPGTSPIVHLDFADRQTKEVETFTVDEVSRMLHAAFDNDIALLPWLLFGTFAGLRPRGELEKLNWSDVHLEGDRPEILVLPTVSKTKRRRSVDLSPNAVAWIEVYRQRGGSMTGKIIPFSASTLKRKRLALMEKTKVSRWVQQGMRHTYCSNWLAKHGDINKLVLQSGHTSVDTMWQHYYRGTTKADAEKFWNIRPAVVADNIVPMVQAS